MEDFVQGRLSSEPKRNTPADLIIGTVDQDLITWLSEPEMRLVAGAETASAKTPIPTQVVSM
jgi:hypothetical protein